MVAASDPVTVTSPLRVVAYVAMWVSLFTGLFIVYQLWGTGVYAARAQAALEQRFEELAAVVPASGPSSSGPHSSGSADTPTGSGPADNSEPSGADSFVTDPLVLELISRVVDARAGDGIAKLQFPRIGKEVLVVEGVGAETLREGPGRYPSTAYLGGPGNAAVAGHRSTYGAPFGDLDKLRPGDEVVVETPLGVAVYEVMDPRLAFGLWIERVRDVGPGYVVVGPEDGYVLSDVGDDRLTLTACHPRFSASERLIVAARLVSEPLKMLSPDYGLPKSDLGTPTEVPSAATTGEVAAPPSASPPQLVVQPPANVVPVAQVSDLREGLSGWSVGLMPTIVWMLTLLVAMAGATVVKYRRGLTVAVATSVVPVAGILLMLFAQLDRLLPAY
jgi:sortase (surface protein transpeptidase)